MMPVLASYLKECFLPLELLPFYMVPIHRVADLAVISAGLLLFCLIIGGLYLWRRQRQLFFFYVFFFLALLPVSQIVPLVPLKHDRYLYFPLIGFAGFVIQALFLVKDTCKAWSKIAAGAIVALFVLSLPPLTLRQASIWHDDVTLWSHTVRKDPDNMMGWLQLAKSHTVRGDGAAARVAIITFESLTERYGPLRGYENQ